MLLTSFLTQKVYIKKKEVTYGHLSDSSHLKAVRLVYSLFFLIYKQHIIYLELLTDNQVSCISRVSYGIMRVGLEVNVHFHTNEST